MMDLSEAAMPRRSRRMFIKKLVRILSGIVGGAVAIACGEKKPAAEQAGDAREVASCDDLSRISEEDRGARKKLGYVKESPISDNQCQNCNLYLPPKEDGLCGGCMLFKGPVYPTSYCTYWAPKI